MRNIRLTRYIIMNCTKYIATIAALAIAIHTSGQTAAPVSIANYGDGTSLTAKEIAPGIIKVTHTPLIKHGAERPVITTAPIVETEVGSIMPFAEAKVSNNALTVGAKYKGSAIVDKGIKALPASADGVQRYALTISTAEGASLYGGGERGYSLNLANDTQTELRLYRQ